MFLFNFINAQQETIHSPKKATIMSASLPGLGQIYNKKYWKIPIIYTGLTTLGYLTYYYHNNFVNAKKILLELSNTNPHGTIYINDQPYNKETLSYIVKHYNRQRDIFAILTIGFYVLQIIDATVDAHLFNFDVSENLSFSFYNKYKQNFFVLKIKFNFLYT